MSDLVQRLRTRNGRRDGFGLGPVCDEAADEIERLRSSLRRCVDEAEDWLYEARCCAPHEVIGYNGWHDEAMALLSTDYRKPKT